MKKHLIPVVLLACSVLLGACSPTPPAVATLMDQVTEICKAGKQDEIKACYAKEGVKSYQIDQQVGSWDLYFKKGMSVSPYTFSSIRYESLSEAANDKSILPMTISMAQPSSASGIATAPNIKMIGFVLVTFKAADGSEAGSTQYVGIASDGTAKFALVEPRK